MKEKLWRPKEVEKAEAVARRQLPPLSAWFPSVQCSSGTWTEEGLEKAVVGESKREKQLRGPIQSLQLEKPEKDF